MSEQQAKLGRRYSGLDADERTTQRRAALLASGLDLFGTAGYAATSVKQVCGHAGLTQRYFYESFADRQDLLLAVYGNIVDDMRDATVAAMAGVDEADVAATALAAFIGFLTDDPRRARIVLIEVVGVAPTVEGRRLDVMRDFSQLVDSVWISSSGEVDSSAVERRLTSVSLVGAVNHLLVDWLLNGRRDSPAVLTEVCATLFAAARAGLDSSVHTDVGR